MTDSHPPRRPTEDTAHPEHETTALPVTPGQQQGWSQPVTSTSRSASQPVDASQQTDAGATRSQDQGPLGQVSSRLASAGASSVAAATSVATSAREALKGAVGRAGLASSASAPTAGAGLAGAGTAGVPSGGQVGGQPNAGGGSRTTSRAGGGSRGAGASAVRQPRKARLTLSHLNVYSVFKFSCVLAIAMFLVWLITIGVLYGILDVAGAFDRVNEAVSTLNGDDTPKDVVTPSLVFGIATIIGAVYIVLFIALSTVGAMIYNLCADLVGGVELTLSERE